jgi:hypothetical protein
MRGELRSPGRSLPSGGDRSGRVHLRRGVGDPAQAPAIGAVPDAPVGTLHVPVRARNGRTAPPSLGGGGGRPPRYYLPRLPERCTSLLNPNRLC